jgi:hypothetical protein
MADQSKVVTSAVRPDAPARQVIAVFDDNTVAERALNHLADRRFEANRVAIVGAFAGQLRYALPRGQHDLRAVSSLQPRHYDLVANGVVANEALRLLGSAHTGRNDRWQQR